MASFSLCIMLTMLLLNVFSWFSSLPIAFGLTHQMVSIPQLAAMPWWQASGGALLSSIPLLMLAKALWHLRTVFREYAAERYFSLRAVSHLARVARAILGWEILQFLSQPVLSLWVTMLAGKGHRILELGIGQSDIVALYLAGCIAVIAHIMGRARALKQENQQFI